MNGILLVDKPQGWTSHDVAAKLRGALHERRIGHSGTLDPMATGLLVMFVGRATRAAEFAEADRKSYTACLRLGIETDTLDTTGTVTARREADVTQERLEAVLPRFRGAINQIPPMYSAIKQDGRPLYKLARKGVEVERAAREVMIYSLELTGRSGEDFVLEIECSKGTYIRSLCADIGAALGCGGCMSALRRTRAGVFSAADALSLDAVLEAAAEGRTEELLIPVDRLFYRCEAVTLTENQERAVRNGGRFSSPLPEGRYRAYSRTGEFLGLCSQSEGVFSCIKSFYEV